MILGHITNIREQIPKNNNLIKAIDYIESFDPKAVNDGQYHVSDDDVIAIFQTYLTKELLNEIEIEGHRKYIDIYLIIEGTEKIGWGSINDLSAISNYDIEKDVWTDKVTLDDLRLMDLKPGDIAIIFPSDTHASQFSIDTPIQVRKLIMKVKI
jgi:biofilm protein TabA